ncbi:MAG: hypothetical protein NVS4B6_10640 [Mycobacterium sp.]
MTATMALKLAGLTDAEVAQRVAQGKANDAPTRAARSVSYLVRGRSHRLDSVGAEDVHARPSNVAITSIAVGIGRVGAAAIEATWRVQGRILKEPRRMWRAVG